MMINAGEIAQGEEQRQRPGLSYIRQDVGTQDTEQNERDDASTADMSHSRSTNIKTHLHPSTTTKTFFILSSDTPASSDLLTESFTWKRNRSVDFTVSLPARTIKATVSGDGAPLPKDCCRLKDPAWLLHSLTTPCWRSRLHPLLRQRVHR